MSDSGYIAPRRRVELNGDDRPMSLPNPRHAHLSRADLEATVDYWQPKAMDSTVRLNKATDELRVFKHMGLIARLRWAFTPRRKARR